MSTPVRVVGFVVALVAVFGLALGMGRLVGPVDTEPATHGGDHASGDDDRIHVVPVDDGTDTGTGTGTGEAGGLAVSLDGYTLALDAPVVDAGRAVPISFTITGRDGGAVTAYETQHQKDLHLIAVRRDGTGFQHVHPTLSTTGPTAGSWRTTLDLTGGAWRLFADFVPAGDEPLTLGADLLVDGSGPAPVALGDDVRTATLGRYAVSLAGDLTAAADAELTLTVRRDGVPVADLDPYLGAYGHLVALRSGDLAYLHVHPDGGPDDGSTAPGPEVVFHAGVPSTGRYHLYLDFSHGGVVRTAQFLVTAVGTGVPDDSSDDSSEDAGHDDAGHDH